ncbi:MAG TPA: hypothetical protein PLF13_10255 [candidate division Zixibacteria bacterium]|nr:hypothetical protein [candidate division Zixibacteria bacterium]
MKKVIIALAVFLSAAAAFGQFVEYSIFSFQYDIPVVDFNDRSASFQQSLYPRLFTERSATSDMTWVQKNDSTLAAFWTIQGDTILHILRELSGIEWQEESFPLYLVRYYRSQGASDPLVLPLGSFGDGDVLEAAPEGSRLQLTLIYLLAHRMLNQAAYPPTGTQLGISYHPLMRPGAYRRDCLAMLLALSTAENIIGIDSTNDAYNSAFWINHQPGRMIFEEYFKNQWVLSPDHTLADWIAAEPYSSTLVSVTRPPRTQQRDVNAGPAEFVEGLPLKGELGFSVKLDESNRLMIDKIDTYRLAYANGLRQGDRIYRVDGRRPRNQLDMVTRITESLYNGGSTLDIIRDGQSMLLVLQPMNTGGAEYEEYNETYGPAFPSDSLSPVDGQP